MAKRFTNTEIWNDPWYRKLPLEEKVLWRFLCERCDAAGFWKKDFELASFQCGFEVTDEHIESLNKGKERLIDHGEHIEVAEFISFQYGDLTEDCRPHRPIIKLLESYRLKGYQKGIKTLEVKEQDKEKDKEQEQDKEKGTSVLDQPILSRVEAVVTPFDVFWEAYPKKERKKQSKEIWQRKKLDTKLNEILAFIDQAKLTTRWQEGYVKQPPAFLNGECWNDDLAAYNGRRAGKPVAII